MDQTDLSPNKDGSIAVSAQQLRSFVDRIERLEQDKAGIADDIKDCYSEAKGLGYDVKILRKVIALRKTQAQRAARGRGAAGDLSPGAGRSGVGTRPQSLPSATVEPSQSSGGGSVMKRAMRRPYIS